MHYDLTPEQKAYYTAIFTEDPFIYAGDSITRIDEIIKAGSHEPSDDGNVDPDVLVLKNKEYLENQIFLFRYLDLAVPAAFPETVVRADIFLSEGTF